MSDTEKISKKLEIIDFIIDKADKCIQEANRIKKSETDIMAEIAENQIDAFNELQKVIDNVFQASLEWADSMYWLEEDEIEELNIKLKFIDNQNMYF